jgi:DNA-binding NtrC family response regulator
MSTSSAFPPHRKLEVVSINPDSTACARLRAVLRHTNWIFHCFPDLPQALRFLDGHFAPVIVCARQLPSGNWEDLLVALKRFPVPPKVLVYTAECDDAFWMRVLHSGGFHVLLAPFDREVALRLISLACRQWRDQARSLKRMTKNGSSHALTRAAGQAGNSTASASTCK